MNRLFSRFFTVFIALGVSLSAQTQKSSDKYLVHVVDLKSTDLLMLCYDANNIPFGSIGNVLEYFSAKEKAVLFCMNGGMYLQDQSPLGLYIEQSKMIKPLNKIESSFGNFYMQPNGVFFIQSGKAGVVKSVDFEKQSGVRYATQSGPMLLIDGAIHPAFKMGSKNVNIRNGVGILPDGKVLFVLSKVPVNFYEFAEFFKSHGCMNALYLDGFVSRAYLPSEKWLDKNGAFGVMIVELEK